MSRKKVSPHPPDAHTINGQLGPQSTSASGRDIDDIPIDPALFVIEEVVNDVRRGKIRLHETGQAGNAETHMVPAVSESMEGQGIQLDDDGIDPALREIVDSLTNAQQSSQGVGPGLTHAQAAAAIGAHLTDNDESEQRLQRTLQTTLDDLAQASFGSLFPPNFAHSSTNDHYLLPPQESESGPSVLPEPSGPPHGSSTDLSAPPLKRKRGRPKGSKNKPKPEPIARPPKPIRPPKRPKGRPPKIRNEAEQAEHERRMEEKEMGIKRKKGRPRKFPGYLVREMRLKKNRSEFNELLRRHEDERAASDGVVGDDGAREGEAQPEDQVYEGWSAHDQSLLDVVGAAELEKARQRENGQQLGQMEMGGDGANPSGSGKDD